MKKLPLILLLSTTALYSAQEQPEAEHKENEPTKTVAEQRIETHLALKKLYSFMSPGEENFEPSSVLRQKDNNQKHQRIAKHKLSELQRIRKEALGLLAKEKEKSLALLEAQCSQECNDAFAASERSLASLAAAIREQEQAVVGKAREAKKLSAVRLDKETSLTEKQLTAELDRKIKEENEKLAQLSKGWFY